MLRFPVSQTVTIGYRLPSGIYFQYPRGRSTFADKDVHNIEARGVAPDIRVPVTLEIEQAKLKGEEPVLEAAMAELDRQATELLGRLSAQPWQWVSFAGLDEDFKVEMPKNYMLAFSDVEVGEVKSKADRATVAGSCSASPDQLDLRMEMLTRSASSRKTLV
jgi:C-terminal processing protease CtpA/Prc